MLELFSFYQSSQHFKRTRHLVNKDKVFFSDRSDERRDYLKHIGRYFSLYSVQNKW